MRKLQETSDVRSSSTQYVMEGSSVKISGNSITGVIKRDADFLPSYSKAATDLELTVQFYQNGIARITIDEYVTIMEKRYRISDEENFAVM